MTQKKALQDLLVAIEAGELTALAIVEVFNIHPTTASAIKGGSMDAVKSLHDSVLPGWSWVFPHVDNAKIYSPSLNDWYVGYCSRNPAHAWLIAQIKALIAGCDE